MLIFVNLFVKKLLNQFCDAFSLMMVRFSTDDGKTPVKLFDKE